MSKAADLARTASAEAQSLAVANDARAKPKPGKSTSPGADRVVARRSAASVKSIARADSRADTPEGAIQFYAIVRIADYAMLRRAIGVMRAERVAEQLAVEAAAFSSSLRARTLGRDCIEVTGSAASNADVATLLDRLRQKLASPILVGDELCAVQVRVGAAMAERGASDPIRMIEFAEAAIRQAGDGMVALRDLRQEGEEDPLALLHDLNAAIRRGEMFLQFQPKINVRREQVVSAEALIRWRHPLRGLILPGDFIPLAEQAGQITALTLWTLEEAIREYHVLADAGFAIPVFVNISGTLLGDRRFVDQARDLIRGSNAKLGFEITETAVIRDPDTAIAHLKLFSDIGVALAIDDYGAGLSSLAYLKRLPAGELKIDKLFITQLTSSNRDPLIVRSTIDLAHALEMEVTAEGVETSATLALLSVMGCDMVQGYLLSRPIEMAAFLTDLREDRHLPPIQRPRPTFRRKLSSS